MRTITEIARDAFASDSCQCGAFKIGRQYWFCRTCNDKLPEQVRKDLKYLNKNWQLSYQQAMKILESEASKSNEKESNVSEQGDLK